MSETPTDLAESALLEKARAGDFQAFADLCEPCRKPVCAYLAGAGLADPSDAEDVFMDALLRAKRALSAFRGTSSFATWLTTIARNVALDRRRADAAHPLTSLDAAPRTDPEGPAPEPRLSTDDAYPNPSASPIPGESLDSEARIALVRRALEALPGKTREAVVLFYVEQKPYNEIAQILDIPLGTVMSRLHNGRKRLQQLLSPHRDDLAF